MTKFSLHSIQRKILLFLLVLIITASSLSAYAAAPQPGEVIRVGVYSIPGYHMYDENGSVYGYEIEYLNLIAKETGWTYQFIPVSSWEEGMKMLRNGEIDLLSPAVLMESRLQDFSFSAYPIGKTCSALMTLSGSSIMYEDYAAFSGLTIGVEADTISQQALQDYASTSGFHAHIRTYRNHVALIAALKSKQVDAIATTIMRKDDSMKVIGKYSCSAYYFMMQKSATQLRNRLNKAIDAVVTKNPMLQSQLEQQYFPDLNTEPVTKSEANFVRSSAPITVGVSSGQTPFSFYDSHTGKLTGINIKLLNLLSNQSGLTFRTVTLPEGDLDYDALRKEGIKMVLGVRQSVFNRSLPTLTVSEPYLKTQDVLIAKSGFSYVASKHYTIALLDQPATLTSSVLMQYPNFHLQIYATTDDCLQAVKSGKVDMALLNQLTADTTLRRWRYSDLLTVPGITFDDNLSLAILPDKNVSGYAAQSAETATLVSIMNKAIRSLNSDVVNATVTDYTISASYQITFADLWDRWHYAILIIALSLLLLLAAIILTQILRARYVLQLQHKNAELQSANSAKSDFLSRMSHDIRTPMNAIIGMTHIALDEELNNPVIADCLSKINSSSHFMLGLVNDILDMTKIDSGKMELHPEPYATQDFTETISAMINPLSAQKDIHFSIHTDPKLTRCMMADKLRLNQIFFNLLSNAVKFTDRHGTVSLSLESLPQESNGSAAPSDTRIHIRFTVQDNGIGMSPAFLPQMFEAFSQENASNTAENVGSGLGLSIVKSIVDLMQGTIEVESVPQKGTTFTLCLSFDEASEDAVNAASKPPLAVDFDILHGKRILLAEDNSINTQVARILLAKKQMSVEHAKNGVVALQMFAASPPGYYDAILMDIRMPEMNGLEATKMIRQMLRPDAKSVPIIALTADAFTDDIRQTTAAEMNTHLTKPIEPTMLYQTLADQIAKRNS